MLKSAWISILSLVVWAAAQAAPPASPALNSPADAAVNQPVSNLVLSWIASAGAATYQVQVSKHQDFSAPTLDQGGITDVTKILTGLENGTQYFWHVRATNASGNSGYSNPRSFTTIPTAPVATTLSKPADAAVDVALKPVFNWKKVDGATSYHIQITDKADFTTTMTSEDSTLGDTVFTQGSDLAFSTVYRWRVRTKNAGGVSAYSTPRTFKTIPAKPAIPAPATPGDNATNLTLPVTLRWHKSDRAANYRVQVSTKKDFSSNIVVNNLGNDTVYAIQDLKVLAYSTTYYWRVRAENAGGNSDYSAFFTFKTLEPAEIPALISPADKATDLDVTTAFMWHKTDHTKYYKIQVSAVQDFKTLFKEDSTSNSIDTVKIVSGLANKTTYYWRVESINSAGTKSWGTIRSFTTIELKAPSQPKLSTPADGATGISNEPVLKWHAADRAAGYHVEVSLTSTFATHVFEADNVTDTAKAATGLASSTIYFWRVTAKNAAGTNPSEIRSFTTAVDAASEPVPLSPKDSALAQPKTEKIVWSHSTNAASYHLLVSKKNDFSTVVFEDSTLTDTVKSVGSLENGVTYFWKVRAKNASGVSDYSDARRFTVVVAVPGETELYFPADTAKDVSKDTIEFSWHSIPEASAYRLQVSTNPNFSSFLVNDSTIDSARTISAGLQPNTLYYWRVQALNAGGAGKFTDIRSFKTEAATGIVRNAGFGRGFSAIVEPTGLRVDFTLATDARARVSLINPVNGRTEILLDRPMNAGAHQLGFAGRRAAGIYLLRLEAAGASETKKVFLQ